MVPIRFVRMIEKFPASNGIVGDWLRAPPQPADEALGCSAVESEVLSGTRLDGNAEAVSPAATGSELTLVGG